MVSGTGVGAVVGGVAIAVSVPLVVEGVIATTVGLSTAVGSINNFSSDWEAYNGYKTSYGKSIVISEQKMYQLGNHYNKHGRNMGFSSKKEYEQAARDFFEQYGDVAEIYEGTFNNAHGGNVDMRQKILRHGDKQLIISKESGQLIDFYEGTSLSSFIDVERVQ